MSYRVTHRTEYRYESEVTSSYGLVHLLPRDLDGQVTSSSQLTIVPEPDDARGSLDDVRRLTNFSTGRLGTELANFLKKSSQNPTCSSNQASLLILALPRPGPFLNQRLRLSSRLRLRLRLRLSAEP